MTRRDFERYIRRVHGLPCGRRRMGADIRDEYKHPTVQVAWELLQELKMQELQRRYLVKKKK